MADYEQLLLFDLAPYIAQQTSVEGKALGFGKEKPLKQLEYKQLELKLFSKQADESSCETLRLAA